MPASPSFRAAASDVPRPAPDAPIYRWVDRNGDAIESTAPSFDLTLGDAGSSLTRIDGEATFTRFTLPTVFQNPRDFPTTIATDDGGALSTDFVQTRSGGVTVLVDFDTDWPEFGIDNGDVYYQPIGDTLGIPCSNRPAPSSSPPAVRSSGVHSTRSRRRGGPARRRSTSRPARSPRPV